MEHAALDKSGLRELMLDGVDPDSIPSVRPGPGDYASASRREKWLGKRPEDRETAKFWSHFPGAASLRERLTMSSALQMDPPPAALLARSGDTSGVA